jgi:hypothetical protein
VPPAPLTEAQGHLYTSGIWLLQPPCLGTMWLLGKPASEPTGVLFLFLCPPWPAVLAVLRVFGHLAHLPQEASLLPQCIRKHIAAGPLAKTPPQAKCISTYPGSHRTTTSQAPPRSLLLVFPRPHLLQAVDCLLCVKTLGWVVLL